MTSVSGRNDRGTASGSHPGPAHPKNVRNADEKSDLIAALPLRHQVPGNRSSSVSASSISTWSRFGSPCISPVKVSAPHHKLLSRSQGSLGKHDMLARSAVGVVYKTFCPNKCTSNRILANSPQGHRAMRVDAVQHKQSETMDLYANPALRRGPAPVRPALAVEHLSTPSVKLSQGHMDKATADLVTNRQGITGVPKILQSQSWHPLHRHVWNPYAAPANNRTKRLYQSTQHAPPEQPSIINVTLQKPVVAVHIPTCPQAALGLRLTGSSGQANVQLRDRQTVHACPVQPISRPFHINDLSESAVFAHSDSVPYSSCNHAVSSRLAPPYSVNGSHSQQGKVNTFVHTCAASIDMESEAVATNSGTSGPCCDIEMAVGGCGPAGIVHEIRHDGSLQARKLAMQAPCSSEEVVALTCQKASSPAGWHPTGTNDMVTGAHPRCCQPGNAACDATMYLRSESAVEADMDCQTSPHGAVRRLQFVECPDAFCTDDVQNTESTSQHLYDEGDALSLTGSMSPSCDESFASPDVDRFAIGEMESLESADNSLTMIVDMSAGLPSIASYPLNINEQSLASPKVQEAEGPTSCTEGVNDVPQFDDTHVYTRGEARTESGNTTKWSCESPGDLESNDNIVEAKRVLGNRYVVDKVVGEGAYGIVMKCHLLHDVSRIVAVKEFKITESDSDAEEVKRTAHREAALMKSLRHENITMLLDTFLIEDKLCICMEFTPRTLLELLEGTNSGNGLHPDLVKKIIYQTLSAIVFLHSQDIVFRDVKPENVLITDELNVKLCDFGFARLLPPDTRTVGGTLTDYVATRWYRAPELLLGNTYQTNEGKWRPCYGKTVDIWSVGCLMAELITGQPLFPGESDLDQLYKIMSILGPMTDDHTLVFHKNPLHANITFQIKSHTTLRCHFAGHVPDDALTFMEELLKMDPHKRLCGHDTLMHPYFHGMPGKSKSSTRS